MDRRSSVSYGCTETPFRHVPLRCAVYVALAKSLLDTTNEQITLETEAQRRLGNKVLEARCLFSKEAFDDLATLNVHIFQQRWRRPALQRGLNQDTLALALKEKRTPPNGALSLLPDKLKDKVKVDASSTFSFEE